MMNVQQLLCIMLLHAEYRIKVSWTVSKHDVLSMPGEIFGVIFAYCSKTAWPGPSGVDM